MPSSIVAFAQQQTKAAIGRAVRPAALASVAALFFLFAVAALFCALFFWLEPLYGRAVAALIVAAVAFVLGLVATLALIIGRRPEPAPPPAAAAPELVSLLAQSAASLGPKQTAVAAFVLALALGLMARGSSGGKK